MNLEVLKRSRRRPVVGDIFVYKMRGLDYGFGRVIRTDAFMDPWSDLLLLYIYRAFSEKKAHIPLLDKRDLLIPPFFMDRFGAWTTGYFETIASHPLAKNDTFRVHCFESRVRRCYVDEFGRKLRRRREPCGFFALDSRYIVDVAISLALGVEPDPDTLPPPRK